MRLRQILCGLIGHDLYRHFTPERVSLRCVACQAETPGWSIASNGAAPKSIRSLPVVSPQPNWTQRTA